MASFNVEEALSKDGFTLLGVGEKPGEVVVTDAEGNEKVIDVGASLSQKGIKDYEINSPSTAIGVSPISVLDRLKIKSLGDENGQFEYLKKNYGEVRVDEEKGLVVKYNNAWHSVDPSGWGDSYKITDKIAELAKDVTVDAADLYAKGYLASQGAAAGVAAGASVGAAFGGVGAIPGAVIGGMIGAGLGGGVGELGRTILGKAVETYGGDTTQIAKDVGLEVLLNAGGQGAITALFGTKALKALSGTNGAKVLKDAIENIKANATPETMPLLEQFFVETAGKATGGGPKVVETMLNQTDDVSKRVGLYSKLAPSIREETIIQNHMRDAQNFYNLSQRKLTTSYGQYLDELKSAAAGSDLEVDFKQLFREVADDLASKGAAVIERPKLVPESLPTYQGLGLAGETMAPATTAAGKFKIRVPSAMKQGKLAAEGTDSGTITPELAEAMDSIYSEMNSYMKGLGKAKGAKAAELLMGMRKRLNSLWREKSAKLAAGTESEKIFNGVRESYANAIQRKFNSAGLTEHVQKTSDLYEQFAEHVQYLGQSLSDKADPTAMQTFVNQLLAKNPASGGARKYAVGVLEELTGKEGRNIVGNMKIDDSARTFSSLLPTGLASRVGAGTAVATAAATGNPVLAGGIALASSPRGLLGTTKALKTMRKLGSHQLLRQPDALRTLIPEMLDQTDYENGLSQQLLQEALGGGQSGQQ